MSSFEFKIQNQSEKPEKGHREIAVVVEKTDKFVKKIVPKSLLTISENDDVEGGKLFNTNLSYTRNLIDNKYQFQIVPDRSKERDIIYCTGQSGSGKSYWCAQYCQQYKRIYPSRKIYLISSLAEDDTLEKLNEIEENYFIRINISPELISDAINAKDFKESLVIFDDFEVLKDKKIKEYVCKIRDEILETGRHYKTSMICTYHLPTNHNDTRRIINEAHAVIFFPHVSNFKIKNLLENYLGMHKDFLHWTKRRKSRWACILRGFPNMFINDSEVWLTNELQDSEFK